MKKKTLINILMVICFLIAIGSGGYLAYYYLNSNKSENAVEDLRQMIVPVEDIQNNEQNAVPEFVMVDGVQVQRKFENLYNKNKDFVGWITIEDTKIDYPVMHTPNDSENGEFYIHRDYEMNYSAAGLPFIDKNCDIEYPTDNIIIYAHNMNSGTMFHDIIKYESQEFYESHKTFKFDSIYGDGTYEVVAAFYGEILPEESAAFKYYEFVNAGDEQEFHYFVENINAMSIIDTEGEVEYGDKLLTLSTCAYHVDDGRFVVIAKKI